MRDEAEQIRKDFRIANFPNRPVQEAKIAFKILDDLIRFKDVLFLVEQSSRVTADLVRGSFALPPPTLSLPSLPFSILNSSMLF